MIKPEPEDSNGNNESLELSNLQPHIIRDDILQSQHVRLAKLELNRSPIIPMTIITTGLQSKRRGVALQPMARSTYIKSEHRL